MKKAMRLEDTFLSYIRKLVRENGYKIVVVDGFSFCLPDGKKIESMVDMSELMKSLRDLATEEGILVVMIHHPNKNKDAKGNDNVFHLCNYQMQRLTAVVGMQGRTACTALVPSRMARKSYSR